MQIMQYRGLQNIILQSNSEKFHFMFIKKYANEEILSVSIKIHGITIVRQAEVK